MQEAVIRFNGSVEGQISESATSCHINNATKPLRCGWPKEPAGRSDLEYLDLISYPILLVLSTVGNVLNIFVLQREGLRTSQSVYLMAVACLDLTYMWSEVTRYIEQYTWKLTEFERITSGFTLYLQEAAVTAADWTLAAFSLDRFLAIQSPLHHRTISSRRRSKLITGALLLISCVLASPRLVDYYWMLANDLGPPGDPPIRPETLQNLSIFYLAILTFTPIVTFFTILIINSLLMRALVQRRKQHGGSLRVSISSTAEVKLSMASMEQSASLMLAACVLLYLITQTPCIVLNILDGLDRACIRRLTRETQYITEPIKLFFIKLNYSLNFVLYCALNPRFRVALRKHLRRLFYGSRRESGLSSFSYNFRGRISSVFRPARAQSLKNGEQTGLRNGVLIDCSRPQSV